MKLQPKLISPIRRLFCMVALALLLLGLSFATLENFTPKVFKVPILGASAQAKTSSISLTLTTINPVNSAFISAVPDANGNEIFVAARGINAAEGQIILNIKAGVGGGAHEDSHAMTLSGTTHIATAIGFTPGKDTNGEDTMSITTTVGSEIVGTGDINFQRAFIEPDKTETIWADGGAFELRFFKNSMPNNTYVLVMSTNQPPGALPLGYQLVGKTYNVRPSGSRIQSDKPMILNLSYAEPLPNNIDPHTLTIMAWDAFNQRWDNLGGTLEDEFNSVTLGIQRFTIYALASTLTWGDSFEELEPTGVLTHTNIDLQGLGDPVKLSSDATIGSLTSKPITPTNGTSWGTLNFNTTTTLSNGLSIDVLDMNQTPVLTNVSDGIDLSALSTETYPALHLRATLTRTTTTVGSPQLHDWQISWLPEIHNVYLPLVMKSGL